MATYYTLLTKIGQARIANAVALNQMVNLTYMAVGDGNGNPTTPNENQTALVREKYRATINQLTVDADNPNYLVAELIVPTNVGGWSIYEVGVFDDQNQLIAVANFPATYKPELAEGSGRDLIVRIIIQVSNTSVVTLKIDPAITLASQAWVAANYVKKITVAGGTTGQILAKKSNANEDFQWVDPTAAVDVNVFSREETQTVATGQTIINLAQLTTDGAAIYIEGIRLRDDQFTVNSSTRLTLATSYPAGTKVTIVQNEETSRNAFTLKANNLSDLTDKAAARTNLGLDAMGIGTNNSPFITTGSTFDWQSYDFKAGESIYIDTSVMVNTPAEMVYPSAVTRLFITTEGARKNAAYELRVTPSTATNSNYKTYALRITGSAGSRSFQVREELSSAIPVTIAQGGTGATTTEQALVNLGLTQNFLSGRLRQVYKIENSTEWVWPEDAHFIRVTLVGAGGGGGGCHGENMNQTVSGGGGGAGGAIYAWYGTDYPGVTPGMTINVTVGSGGNGGVGAGGGSKGGDTIFLDSVAVGGSGASSNIDYNEGGIGGQYNGPGYLGQRGGDGSDGQSGAWWFAGNGGSSIFGGGGRAGVLAGFPGVCSGSGGGGAYDPLLRNTSGTGGRGANGVVIIEVYY